MRLDFEIPNEYNYERKNKLIENEERIFFIGVYYDDCMPLTMKLYEHFDEMIDGSDFVL